MTILEWQNLLNITRNRDTASLDTLSELLSENAGSVNPTGSTNPLFISVEGQGPNSFYLRN